MAHETTVNNTINELIIPSDFTPFFGNTKAAKAKSAGNNKINSSTKILFIDHKIND